MPAWVLALSLPVFLLAVLIKKQRKIFITGGFCLLALLGGTLRYQSSLPPSDNTSLQFYNGKGVVKVEGMVSNAPETRKSSIVFRLAAGSVTADNRTSPINGDVLVNVPFYKQIHYGDVLQLTGKLETPPQFDDFDYKNYLYNQGIYSLIYYPRIEVLETDRGIKPLAWIYSLRQTLSDSLSACLPEPQGSLAQAILLGIRGNLPQSLRESFYATGTTHLIAISGLNLTIILGMLLPLTVRLLGRKNRIYVWLSLAFIWLYTLLTGLSPTVMRAAFMASIFLAAELLGRQRNATAAMSFAAAVMVAIDPRVLWDASFQLSFLSMLGLILVSPYLVRMISPGDAGSNGKHRNPWISMIVTTFGTTLAAIIATWPITALDFHSFSLVGAPATFFAMPAFPGIIATSMLTALAGSLWHPAGVFFGWIAWLFLGYFELVVKLFSAIPIAYITDIKLQIWQAIAYYVILAGLLFAIKNKQAVTGFFYNLYDRFRRFLLRYRMLSLKPYMYPALALLTMANILVWTAFATLPDGKLHVNVLDVSQGESILIRTPDRQNILVDTGPDPIAACTALGRKLPFQDRNIDMVILTQMQSDHMTGTFEILRRYNVHTIALPHYNNDPAIARELLATIEKTSTNICYLQEGQQMDLGRGIRLTVLNPPPCLHEGTDDDTNNNSVVLKLSWNEVSFLLTADMGIAGERYLVEKRSDLHSDVLKVGHHGSKGSTCDEFLAIVNPAAAVISCGAVNRFGHPNQEVMDKLKKRIGSGNVSVTATQGNIEFTTDGYRLWRQVDNIAVK